MTTITERLTTLLDQQYLASLSEADSQELTQLLKTEEGQKIQADHLAIREGLILAGRDSMKSKIYSWETELNNSNSEARIRRFPMWGRIAAVAAAIMMLMLIFRPGNTDSRTALFEELSQPYPNVLMPVERGSQTETKLEEAFAAYEAGNYAEVLRFFEEADTASLELDFYRANALLTQHKHVEALTIFSSIAGSESQFAQQAEWYEAMTLWKDGQQTEAEEIIRRIAEDEGHEMWKRAQRWGE